MTTKPVVRLTDPLDNSLNLTGRRVIVTGGAGGLGLATTTVLAARGATVIIGTRNTIRGEEARRSLLTEHNLPPDRIQVVALDLIDPKSVRQFADRVGGTPVDVLVLNAGISSVPFHQDANGVESQFATNHLGHFALTGHLLPALDAAPAARVVTISSALYKRAKLDLGRLSVPDGYSPGRAYSRSKLANAIFAVDLDRRLIQAGSRVRSFAAHPGMARTPLHATYPSKTTRVITSIIARAIGRNAKQAAVGILTAAMHPEADPGLFWGPTGSRTHPKALGVPFSPIATGTTNADELWRASEKLTGIQYLS
jgi:NAD(P)-dependent dehydrogenase (short-subunit alcohol dehydrogenase family)